MPELDLQALTIAIPAGPQVSTQGWLPHETSLERVPTARITPEEIENGLICSTTARNKIYFFPHAPIPTYTTKKRDLFASKQENI